MHHLCPTRVISGQENEDMAQEVLPGGLGSLVQLAEFLKGLIVYFHSLTRVGELHLGPSIWHL